MKRIEDECGVRWKAEDGDLVVFGKFEVRPMPNGVAVSCHGLAPAVVVEPVASNVVFVRQRKEG